MFHPVRAAELFARHLTRRDAKLLNDLSESRLAPMSVAAFDTGWFVQVGFGSDDGDANQVLIDEFRGRPFSRAFMNILGAAQEDGLAFLRVHADADRTPGLPVFDW